MIYLIRGTINKLLTYLLTKLLAYLQYDVVLSMLLFAFKVNVSFFEKVSK